MTENALPILDWKPRHDPRSRNFPFRALVGDHVEPRKRQWKQGTVLDQGSEGACVGFGWTGELLASPRRNPTTVSAETGNSFALDVYHAAQEIDYWPGTDYSGTSVLAGAQIIQQKGLISEYRWCFGIEDVRDALIAEGPVVIGIPWYESMYYTDADANVVVDGDQVGGHCILLTGYNPDRDGVEKYRWRNSWGKSYGNNGSAWITAADLAELLADGGEACVPMGRYKVDLNA